MSYRTTFLGSNSLASNTSLGWVAAMMLIGSGPVRSQPIELMVGSWLDTEITISNPVPIGLNQPFGIDFDSRGNMYIVELAGGRVHRLTVDGHLSVIAGNGVASYTGDGGPASEATFNGMHNVAVAPNGRIYIADSWNHCVRQIDIQAGRITTIAGAGSAGYRGDGGLARTARFDYVMCVTLDPEAAQLYLADLRNLRVRRVDLKSGLVHLVAGNGMKGVPLDGSIAVDSPLQDPRAVAVDSQRRVYILERGGHALRVVTPDGRIRTLVGDGTAGWKDGVGRGARLNGPKHLCLDADDFVYIADDQNGAIRKYDPQSNSLTTILGRGQGTPSVTLKNPHGVCVEGRDLYIVDTGHDRILKLPLSPN